MGYLIEMMIVWGFFNIIALIVSAVVYSIERDCGNTHELKIAQRWLRGALIAVPLTPLAGIVIPVAIAAGIVYAGYKLVRFALEDVKEEYEDASRNSWN